MMELVLMVASVFGLVDNSLIGADNQLLSKVESTASVPDKVQEAIQQAVDSGKPVILWVGGNFCSRCVNDSQNEFIHVFLEEWNGHRGPATVILAHYGKQAYRVGTVTRWTVGTHDWGHIPSARRLVHEWRSRAAQGDLRALPLIYLSGGHWGWPADRKQLPPPYRVQPGQHAPPSQTIQTLVIGGRPSGGS